MSRISGMEWWNGTLEWNTGMTQIVFNTFPNHKFEKIRFHKYCNLSIIIIKVINSGQPTLILPP